MSLRSVVLPLVALAVVGGAAALTWMVVAGSGGATLEPADGGAAVEPSAPGDRPEPAPEPVRERQPRPADPPADGQPWVPAPGLEDALAAVPWAEAGGMMRELVPLLADAAIAAVHADMIRDGDAQRATELRGKLAAPAQAHPAAAYAP